MKTFIKLAIFTALFLGAVVSQSNIDFKIHLTIYLKNFF